MRPKADGPGAGEAWTIEQLADEIERDTIVDDDGNMYHNYFLAVALERGDERLRLLYFNQLPASFAFEENDQVLIDGLENAEYDNALEGYWLQGLSVRATP